MEEGGAQAYAMFSYSKDDTSSNGSPLELSGGDGRLEGWAIHVSDTIMASTWQAWQRGVKDSQLSHSPDLHRITGTMETKSGSIMGLVCLCPGSAVIISSLSTLQSA
jgi:hypothetical protein